MIEIKNLRKENPKYPYDVRVDRKSVLGNKFIMHKESERDKVCDAYKEWFEDARINDIKVKLEIGRLKLLYDKYGQLNLFCWCAPKRCHAEIIMNYILNIN